MRENIVSQRILGPDRVVPIVRTLAFTLSEQKATGWFGEKEGHDLT